MRYANRQRKDAADVIACVMRLALVVVVAACSSGSPNQPAPASPSPPPVSPSPPPSSPSSPPAAQRAITAEAFCERLAKLASECKPFAKLSLAADTCVAETSAVLASKPPNSQVMTLIRCAVEGDGCDDTLQCLTLDLEDPPAGHATLRACNDRSPDSALRAVAIPPPEWARRNGVRVTAYRAASSTKAAPIEMCGVSAANEWLTTLRCDDGSRPIADRREAERARIGSVGPGGRCGAIIDHYVIPCPEASYKIFIDAYICPGSN
jgi:hypothetical protein